MKGLKFFFPKCSEQLSIDRIMCVGGTERQEWGTSELQGKWRSGSSLTHSSCLFASCLVVKSFGGEEGSGCKQENRLLPNPTPAAVSEAT